MRHAVRVESVDQSSEHHAGEIRWVVEADLNTGEYLLTLPLDFGRVKRWSTRDLGQ